MSLKSKDFSAKIFISSMEVSSDFQAFLLFKNLKKHINFQILGLGSSYLKSLSEHIKYDFSYISSIGFLESLISSFKIFPHLFSIIKIFYKEPIRLAIFVDAPAFNILLARFTRKLKIPSIYYFPPSHFTIDSKKAQKILSSFHFIITPFYNDYCFYKKEAENLKTPSKVFYIQHPLTKISYKAPKVLKKNSKENLKSFKILFFPGSRKHEIKKHLPIFLEILKSSPLKSFNIEWTIVLAQIHYKSIIVQQLSKFNVSIHYLKAACYLEYKSYDIALAKSGTTILELALLGIPTILIYKMNFLSYFLLYYFELRNKNLKFYALPNILMNENWIPELIQKDCNSSNIEKYLIDILKKLQDYKNIYKEKSEKLHGILNAKNSKQVNLLKLFQKIWIKYGPKK